MADVTKSGQSLPGCSISMMEGWPVAQNVYQQLYLLQGTSLNNNLEAVMYLRDKGNGDLVEVLDISAMVDPCRDELQGRYHAGEELQDPAAFRKSDLAFPSGEELPRCWIDAGYKDSTD
jgi:hypothetical protein